MNSNKKSKEPLAMRQLGSDGPFVPEHTLCTKRRREFLFRLNRIIAFYSAVSAFVDFGYQALLESAKAKTVTDSTPMRYEIDNE